MLPIVITKSCSYIESTR